MAVKQAKEAAIAGISKGNPIAGSALSSANEKHEAKKAVKKEKTAERKAEMEKPVTPSKGKGGKVSGPSFGSRAVSKIGGKNLLLGELTVCLVILVLGTIVAPSGSDDGTHRMLVKGSALMGVFFILAIASTGGKGPQKVASALGLLIALSYVLTSNDMKHILSWSTKFFTTENANKVPASDTSSTPPASFNGPPPTAIYT